MGTNRAVPKSAKGISGTYSSIPFLRLTDLSVVTDNGTPSGGRRCTGLIGI